MYKIYILVIGLLLTLMACQSSPDQLDSQFRPPEGHILTFMHELDYARYDFNLMPKTYGVTVYANLNAQVTFEIEKDQKVRELGELLGILKDKPLIIMLRLTNRHMEEIVKGAADSKLDKLAEIFKSHSKQIYLAVGYEVNNLRYMINPELYVQAHQFLVNRFRQNDVENISYVWHVIGMKPVVEKPIPLEQCYPGDDYVDWVGLSMHLITQVHFDSSGFYESPAYDEVAVFAQDHNLPIMLCETSTTSILKNFGYSGDALWQSWYRPFFDFVNTHDVRAIAHNFYFFNDTLVLNRWRNKMTDLKYIYPRPATN